MPSIPPIDHGELPLFQRALSRIVGALDEIVVVRGQYEPGRYGARLAFALTLSLLVHAFVLSLRFGIAGLGLPGFALPWAERRGFTSDLSVRLTEALRARTPPAPPARPESVRRPAPIVPVPPPAVQPVRPPVLRPPAPRTLVVRKAATRVKRRAPRVKAPVVARAIPRPAPETARPLPAPAVAAPRTAAPVEQPVREAVVPRTAQPEIIAQAEPRQETFSVPAPTPEVAVPAVEVKPQVEQPPVMEQVQPSSEEPKVDQEAARLAADRETVALEQARRQEETKRQEQARAAREASEREASEREASEREVVREAERRAEERARQQAAERLRALEFEARRQEEARRLEQAAASQRAAERLRALELEAKQREQALRQEEAKKQEQANAARLAMELEALRQAEDLAKQQAAALARQREQEAKRQAEELAARERAAQELAAREKAEALAAGQRQRDAERLAADNAASRAALAAAEPGRSSGGTIGPGNISGRDLAAKALDQLRAPGALRGEPQGPRSSSPLLQSPPSAPGADNPRRRSVPGGFERDIGLRMYVESWRWKIERNGSLNYPSGARTRAAENPVVTVAIRRDGSVEDVHIHRSSGQRDLDERVRLIARLNAPYSAFPPDLARAFDVIEIRRVWVFGNTLRIVEELN